MNMMKILMILIPAVAFSVSAAFADFTGSWEGTGTLNAVSKCERLVIVISQTASTFELSSADYQCLELKRHIRRWSLQFKTEINCSQEVSKSAEYIGGQGIHHYPQGFGSLAITKTDSQIEITDIGGSLLGGNIYEGTLSRK